MSDDIHDFFNDDDSWGNAQQDDAGAPPAPPRSRRDMRMKRKSKQRHRMVKLIIALIVGGIYAYRAVKQWRHNTLADSSVVEDYPGPGSGSVAFTVTAGEGVTQIAEHLVREGVIKSVDAFTGVVSANDMTLYPGTYELKHQMKASQAWKLGVQCREFLSRVPTINPPGTPSLSDQRKIHRLSFRGLSPSRFFWKTSRRQEKFTSP